MTQEKEQDFVFLAGGGEVGELMRHRDWSSAPLSAKPMPRRILVVDDNIDVAGSTAGLLRLLGNEVGVAHDDSACVELVSRMEPDAVLLDIGLPAGRHLRLIALTGWWGTDEEKRRSAEAGFDEHWIKPIDLEQLKRR